MTLQEAYHFIRTTLITLYDDRESANIANLVMENITGHSRMERLVHRQTTLTPLQQQQLENYISRLGKNVPVQYVLQEAWFYNIPFYVNEHVLIPRPETEELVSWIIQDEKNKTEARPVRILDIGTGSGCIPVTLKKNLPSSEIHALDISANALEVARKNADQQNTSIHFHTADILQLQQESSLPLFDIIISNPPYIPVKEKAGMQKNVLDHEPHLALFVNDNDPLLFYRAISNFARHSLAKNGSIYLELHEQMAQPVAGLFVSSGFSHTTLRKDMQGKDRMLKVSL
ncbi:MAG: peptide chain release factor N(5)-glutamine methyltransferase [Chitinophagaceae bacterium]|nr:peptide chain release factor N(5)-glutamine methyltransferase [Chitinophagaceae bacterium]